MPFFWKSLDLVTDFDEGLKNCNLQSFLVLVSCGHELDLRLFPVPLFSSTVKLASFSNSGSFVLVILVFIFEFAAAISSFSETLKKKQ